MNFRAQISSTAFYEFWYIEWYSTMMSCYHWWFIILPRFMNFRLIFLPRIINFRLKWVYRVSAFTAFYECTLLFIRNFTNSIGNQWNDRPPGRTHASTKIQNKNSFCSARPADREAGAKTNIAKKNSVANLIRMKILQRFWGYLANFT